MVRARGGSAFEDTKLMVPVGYEHVLEWITAII